MREKLQQFIRHIGTFPGTADEIQVARIDDVTSVIAVYESGTDDPNIVLALAIPNDVYDVAFGEEGQLYGN